MAIQSRVLGRDKRKWKKSKPWSFGWSWCSQQQAFHQIHSEIKDGYIGFILDRKTEEEPSQFKDVEFSNLYAEFVKKQKGNAFGKWIDQEFEKLSQGSFELSEAQTVILNAKAHKQYGRPMKLKVLKSEQLRKLRWKNWNFCGAWIQCHCSAKQRKSSSRPRNRRSAWKPSCIKPRKIIGQSIIGCCEYLGTWRYLGRARKDRGECIVRTWMGFIRFERRNQNWSLEGRFEYSRSENVRSLLVDDLIAAGLNP